MNRLRVFKVREGIRKGLWAIMDSNGSYRGYHHHRQSDAFKHAERLASHRPGFGPVGPLAA